MNKWLLMGEGDILLLHTDGLGEHARGDEEYFPSRLEAVDPRGQTRARPATSSRRSRPTCWRSARRPTTSAWW